ncbi:MAG: PHB depolymerase family esterase, partial [Gemmatimonas sp.]
VMRQFPVDPARVHIAGISAGAAMAGLLAVAYPERFATLVSLSGIPWQAAKNVGTALSVMKAGAGASTPTAEALVLAMGARRRALPVLVVHGGADAVVAYQNAVETSAQWVGVHDRLRATNGQPPLQIASEVVSREHEYTTRRVEWRDADGSAQVTRLRIDELGHAWAGGSPAGTFTDANGPDVSTLVAMFCERHQLR